MMSRLFHMISLLCIVVTLTVLGFVVLLGASGRLTGENLDAIADILRGGQDADEQPEPTTQPTTQPGDVAVRTIGEQEAQAQLQRLELQRRMQELQAQRRQAEQMLHRIAAAREQLREEALAFAEQVRQHRERAQDEDFQAQLDVYETMPPREVKTIFMGMDVSEAAAFLRAMPARGAGRILSQFRTPAEQQFRQQLLQEMEQAG